MTSKTWFNSIPYITFIMLCIVVSSCRKKDSAPEPNPGSEPRIQILLTAPEHNVETMNKTIADVNIRSGNQSLSVTTEQEWSLLLDVLKPATEQTQGQSKCSITKAMYRMNDIEASSDEDIPMSKEWTDPLRYANTPEAQKDRVRNGLVKQLKKLTEDINLTLSYDRDFADASSQGLTPEVVADFDDIGKPMLAPLTGINNVLALFVAQSYKLMPDSPVGQGAIWKASVEDPFIAEGKLETIVCLESISVEEDDQIAVLTFTHSSSFPGERQITTPTGESIKAKGYSFKNWGRVTINVTKKREIDYELNSTGSWTAINGQQVAECQLTAKVTSLRKYE